MVEDSDLTKAVANEASRYPGQEKQVVEFYKQNPNLMQSKRCSNGGKGYALCCK